MADTPDITVTRKLYDSKGDPAVARQIMSPGIVWDITPGFPHGGVYNGVESTIKDFFGQWAPHFQVMHTDANAYYDAGNGNIFVEGYYRGITTNGRKLEVRFTHHWTVRDGKLAELRQAADSYLAREAIGM